MGGWWKWLRVVEINGGNEWGGWWKLMGGWWKLMGGWDVSKVYVSQSGANMIVSHNCVKGVSHDFRLTT